MLTKNILLLDDDADEALILRDAFKDLRIPVLLQQVLTFEQMLAHLASQTLLPDLLLLDINLPGQTGLEVITFLQSHESYSRMPVVMYTNAADERTIDDSFAAGASAYMKKTIEFNTLKRNLQILMQWNLNEVFNLPVTSRTLLN